MNFELYASKTLELKGIDNDEKLQNELSKELRLIFDKRYNAICIDIDGALVDENLNGSETIELFNRFIKNHIPIVIATGRGESSTREYVKKLTMELYSKYKMPVDYFKYISCICNNGTIAMYTSENDQEKFLQNVHLMVPKESVDKIKDLYVSLSDNIYKEFPKEVKIGKSYSESLKCITEIRFVMEDETVKETLWKRLQNYLLDINLKNDNVFKLTTGEYNNKKIIQISVEDNEQSIVGAESRLGIPRNSMVRIFDQGDECGNDFGILNSRQSFSTGTLSREAFACFPVLDSDGNVLKGVQATKYILDKLKITPSICLENINKERYKKQLAIVEKQIVNGRHQVIKESNRIFNNNFDVLNGFSDVFDMETGAVKFTDYEWNLLDNKNPFKEMFEMGYGGKRKYAMEDDASVLLRGPDTYYYMLANKKDKNTKNEKNNLTRNNVIEYKENYMEFIDMSLSAIKSSDNDDKINRRIKLAVIDNVRNLSLLMLNASMVNKYSASNIHLAFDTYKKDNTINCWYEVCSEVTRIMDELCFNKDLNSNITSEIITLLEKTNSLLENTVQQVLDKNDEAILSKCFKSFREIDNFAENRITMKLAIDKIKEENTNLNHRDVSFNGIAYGGIELPFIAKNILKDETNIITNAVLLKGNYKSRHKSSIEEFENEKICVLGNVCTDNSYNIVVDDNILTGKTLQIALNGLFNNGFRVDDLSVVRYPSLNRIEQMCYDGHGAVDVTQFFTYIKGLLFPSPYSKIKSNPKADYKDEFGVFNKSREKLLKCLYKNGIYKCDSEVDNRFRDLSR